MRKKIFIGVFSITFILLGLILSINQAFALNDSVVYTFDDETITNNGITLDVDGESQIFTLTGSNSVYANQILTSPLTVENNSSSALDPLKSYIVIYEYIGGTFSTTDSTVTIYMNDGMSIYTEYAIQTIKLHKTNFQQKKDVLLPYGLINLAKL